MRTTIRLTLCAMSSIPKLPIYFALISSDRGSNRDNGSYKRRWDRGL